MGVGALTGNAWVAGPATAKGGYEQILEILKVRSGLCNGHPPLRRTRFNTQLLRKPLGKLYGLRFVTWFCLDVDITGIPGRLSVLGLFHGPPLEQDQSPIGHSEDFNAFGWQRQHHVGHCGRELWHTPRA